MPAGYFYMPGAPPLLGKPMPRLAISWTQAAGGIVSSLRDMTTWERALYQGQELPPAQQRQLEGLVSEITGKPIHRTSAADPNGYALGVTQLTYKPIGTPAESRRSTHQLNIPARTRIPVGQGVGKVVSGADRGGGDTPVMGG